MFNSVKWHASRNSVVRITDRARNDLKCVEGPKTKKKQKGGGGTKPKDVHSSDSASSLPVFFLPATDSKERPL